MESIAQTIFTIGVKPSDLPPAGYAYRKNKTFDDVKKAAHKALANGRAKFEYELDLLEMYLRLDVFKKLKK